MPHFSKQEVDYMKYIQDLPITHRRVLLRADFNVPLHPDGSISDDTRLQEALPTIKYILSQQASLVLMSHLGRPKGPDVRYSLRGVAGRLESLLHQSVGFVDNCIGKEAEERTRQLPPQSVLLLENLRFHPGETSASLSFAEQLAQHGEIYVNDAFGTAHRSHASTTSILKFFKEKGIGLLIEKELKSLAQVLEKPQRPLIGIIGGAKISDKIGLLKHLINQLDVLLIGGGMSHTFIHALGGEIGDSLLEPSASELAQQIYQSAQTCRIHLPTDACIAKEVSSTSETRYCPSKSIPKGWKGLDIGPETIRNFSEQVATARTIIWNGPMGVAELAPFAKGTEAIASSIAQSAQEKDIFSLIGGGDSVSIVKQLGFASHISHLSTGGGALLHALEGKGLPALTAMDK